ncbi:hypothetical protein [Halorubrum distributum]|uniref:Uncharacterized protein n=1 Tax=Halorubrum distributum TaxID=29283 RepID=A0A6B1INL6_9EURY|nr:hypothetical protein [Halorubrum terrestre]MYL67792.1 hypothetical protein [Halorubrum terrestre]
MSDRDTTTITVTVLIDGTQYIHQVEGTHWRRDDERTVYVYNGDITVLEVDAEYFVDAMREDSVETTVTTTQ